MELSAPEPPPESIVAEAVRVAGGALLGPAHSFPGGRRFHLRDPAGNELAVWSPGWATATRWERAASSGSAHPCRTGR